MRKYEERAGKKRRKARASTGRRKKLNKERKYKVSREKKRNNYRKYKVNRENSKKGEIRPTMSTDAAKRKNKERKKKTIPVMGHTGSVQAWKRNGRKILKYFFLNCPRCCLGNRFIPS